MIINNIKIPRTEIIWVLHLCENGMVKYITASKENDRSIYFLYKIENNGSMIKILKDKNPSEFEELIKLND